MHEFENIFAQDEYKPTTPTVIGRIQQKYSHDNVTITAKPGGKTYICLKDSLYEMCVLNEMIKNETNELRRNLFKTLRVVRQEMRSEAYETGWYPPSDSYLDDLEKYIPANLLLILKKLILPLNKQRITQQKEQQCNKKNNVSHSVIISWQLHALCLLDLH